MTDFRNVCCKREPWHSTEICNFKPLRCVHLRDKVALDATVSLTFFRTGPPIKFSFSNVVTEKFHIFGPIVKFLLQWLFCNLIWNFDAMKKFDWCYVYWRCSGSFYVHWHCYIFCNTSPNNLFKQLLIITTDVILIATFY